MITLPDANILQLLANACGLMTLTQFLLSMQYIASHLDALHIRFIFHLFEDGSFILKAHSEFSVGSQLFNQVTAHFPSLSQFAHLEHIKKIWELVGCLPGALCND